MINKKNVQEFKNNIEVNFGDCEIVILDPSKLNYTIVDNKLFLDGQYKDKILVYGDKEFVGIRDGDFYLLREENWREKCRLGVSEKLLNAELGAEVIEARFNSKIL